MSAPRVSVVIPVFDAGDQLARALESVARQTYRDFEVVVVDDGSTDRRTLAILEAAAREPGVTVHRTPNGGPSRARNVGVERARGAYVLPLDADDYLAPAFLERTAPLLDADPALGVVYTWVGLVGGHHGVWRTGGFSVTDLLSRCTIHVTSLYRRKLWEEVGGSGLLRARAAGQGGDRDRARAVRAHRAYREEVIVGRDAFQNHFARCGGRREQGPAWVGGLAPEDFESGALRVVVGAEGNLGVRRHGARERHICRRRGRERQLPHGFRVRPGHVADEMEIQKLDEVAELHAWLFRIWIQLVHGYHSADLRRPVL